MNDFIKLFLCGDVMTGRGIDQILPFPSDPVIYESFIKNAAQYVSLAEVVNGPIPRSVDFSYIWGDALDELESLSPDFRIINLETTITRSNDYWKGKGINYRMNPANIPSLTTAGIDACSLANNHTLDWGYAGLADTLETLHQANVKTAGAGKNLQEAEAPAIMEREGKGRAILFAFGSITSGIPGEWAAQPNRQGVNLLSDFSAETVNIVTEQVGAVKQKSDIAIFSVHWGSNWGYEIHHEQIQFAHQLIDQAGIDLVCGHSSHHAKALEVYKNKLILYGCGNFLDDYEGIGGYEDFRPDLSLMCFPDLDPITGELATLQMIPLQIKRFRLNHVTRSDAVWLADTLNREGERFGTQIKLNSENSMLLLN
jgi:poly-gamma-glutamate synthesis protein (capsule biosynthesis protein)